MGFMYTGGIGLLLFSVFVAIAIVVWIGWLLLIGLLVVLLYAGGQSLAARVRARRSV